MSRQIRTITNLTVQTGRNDPSPLISQVYSFLEEADTNVSRIVASGEKAEIIVVPDTDIQSSTKFLHISAEGEVSDLEASRAALSIRKYATAKSATSSNEVVSSFDPDTVVFGEMSGEEVVGTKDLAQPIVIKSGAIGAMLSKDSAGADTGFSDNNALPLTLHVENKGTAKITVKVKALYDPAPADHSGTL